MHDKYEEMKRNEKQSQPEIRSKSKWKKDTMDSESQIKGQYNLEGLDLQVNIPNKNTVLNHKIINKVGGQVIRKAPQAKYQVKDKWPYDNNTDDAKGYRQPAKNQSEKRRMLQDEFENMWQ